jgi:hypothetical protein
MILKRYGNRLESVRPNFAAEAMTEIGFRRDHVTRLDAAEFTTAYDRVTEHLIQAAADGDVQIEVEERVLARIAARIAELEAALDEEELLLVENEAGRDPPKLRGRQSTKLVGIQNRYHFEYSVDPPLRLGVYRRGSAT